ncbi:ATP-dependent RNA helicase DHH1 [Aduncisulcus paluster]|uniref:ATP-dependent RNA helicase DHH1 n=1 Tax=Aduncisulcus paluster TaxID=2918883 RepID=A0ABQ5K927_9EUKA|nr:ATP-dependent RNA helicase DHH1 [Aduncisulcus paluster]
MSQSKREIIKEEVVSETTYRSLGLKDDLMRALTALGVNILTPIQAKVIPRAIAGESVVARGKNGTGKTFSYLVPILQSIDLKNPNLQAIIVVPVRELALQISGIIKDFTRYMIGLRHTYVIGGCSQEDNIQTVQVLREGVQIVVGTPGKLSTIAKESYIRVSDVKFFVFDEADKLLEVDETRDIDIARQAIGISRIIPKTAQILLLSATFNRECIVGIKEVMGDRSYSQQNAMSCMVPQGLTHYYVYKKSGDKIKILRTLLTKLRIDHCMIFCNSVRSSRNLLYIAVKKLGFPALAVHSHMTQTERNKAFDKFKKGEARYLICSDLYQRGIDVPSVNIVINFDFPFDIATYLHRAGRASRFGRRGVVISLLQSSDEEKFFETQKALSIDISPFPKEIPKSVFMAAGLSVSSEGDEEAVEGPEHPRHSTSGEERKE